MLICFDTARASAQMHNTTLIDLDIWIFGYLPTNDAIAKVIANDLNLLIRGKQKLKL